MGQADDLLLARPYSPHLFRQGAPQGPYYLREVLRGNLTYKEATKQWQAALKKEEEKESELIGEKWPF